jgi:hypothetical protein
MDPRIRIHKNVMDPYFATLLVRVTIFFQVRIIVREERKGNLLQKEIFIRSCDRYLHLFLLHYTILYNEFTTFLT